MITSPTCTCLGCAHFHLDAAPAEGQDAHHTRILLALDLSLAAAFRSDAELGRVLGDRPRVS